ncbi:MAG: phage BR0599 family protein, partial [Candidatus Acidiferrales bacterium]
FREGINVTFDAQEKLGSGAKPYELYLFAMTGQEFALTTADVPITYLGQTYTPTTMSRTAIEQSNEVVAGQIKVYIPKTHPLALLFLPYLPPSVVSITIFGSHYGDSETVVLFTGTADAGQFTDQCELTCNSDQYQLQKKIPTQLFQTPCSHVFCDAGCTLSITDFTYSGSITAIDSTGTVLTVPAFASLPHSLTGGYFKRGNDVRMVVAHAGDQITLLSAIAGLEVGDACFGFAGCALTFAACVDYNNIDNYLGFDLIPILNPFDGTANIA